MNTTKIINGEREQLRKLIRISQGIYKLPGVN